MTGVIRYPFLSCSGGVRGLTLPKHAVSSSIGTIGVSISFGSNQFRPIVFTTSSRGVCSDANFPETEEILRVEVSLLGIS